MHELALAVDLIELAEAEARRRGSTRIHSLRLRLGPLAGVVRPALEAAFPIAAQGTLAEGARLEIEETPVIIYCTACDAEHRLDSELWLECPLCHGFATRVRSGRELELAALELEVEQ